MSRPYSVGGFIHISHNTSKLYLPHHFDRSEHLQRQLKRRAMTKLAVIALPLSWHHKQVGLVIEVEVEFNKSARSKSFHHKLKEALYIRLSKLFPLCEVN